MTIKQNIVQYELCIKCRANLAKLGTKYCNKCKIKHTKPVVKRPYGKKVYFYRFNNQHSKERLLLNNYGVSTGYPLCIELSIPRNTMYKSNESSWIFLSPICDGSRTLGEFADYVIKSDQISFAYFIISCSSLIQSLPKFQHFIKSKAIDLPPDSLSHSLILPYPITSSLKLIYQPKFWDELLLIFFRDFHPMCPLLSIQSFDKNKVPPTLLFAIYFCAYQFSKEQYVELSEYMEKLAMQNIKKLVRKASVNNVRALVMHTFIAQLSGKLTLAKSLQAHLTRMSYLLGLHLGYSRLYPITRFNRDQVLSAVRNVNLGLSGSNNFSPNYLTEFGKEECNIYDPKWQLPNPSSPIYFENPLENQLYSLCLIEFYKYSVSLIKIVHFPSFSKLEKNTFNRIWQSKVNDLETNHESALQSLNELQTNFADYEANVEPFKTQVKMTYYNALIDMYEIIKQKNESFKPNQVSSILNICHKLYQVHISASNYNPYFQLYSHIIGFHYLNVYPKCTPTEKIRTKQRLQDLILFMKGKFSSHFSLNYLMLKAGYDAINDG